MDVTKTAQLKQAKADFANHKNTPALLDRALQGYQNVWTYYYLNHHQREYLKLLLDFAQMAEALEAGAPSINPAANAQQQQELLRGFFELTVDELTLSNRLPLNERTLFWYQYGSWHYKAHRYVEAESKFQVVLEQKDAPTPAYYEVQYQLARTLRKMGRYPAAERLYQQLEQVEKARLLEADRLLRVRLADDLGLLYREQGFPDKALRQFQIALERFYALENATYNRFKNPIWGKLYAKILRHKGRVYLEADQLRSAQVLYQQIQAFDAQNTRLDLASSGSLWADLAFLKRLEGRDQVALQYYDSTLVHTEDPVERAALRAELAQYHIDLAQPDSAQPHLMSMLQLDRTFLEQSAAFLPAPEQRALLQSVAPRLNQFMDFASTYPDSTLLVTALNAHLFAKGLILESTINIVQRCQETADPSNTTKNILKISQQSLPNRATVKELCQKWKALRRQLPQYTDATAQATQRQKIAQWERRIRASTQSLDFLTPAQASTQSLQNYLKKHPETAILEFVPIQTLNDQDELQLTYHAALLRADDAFPRLIPLATHEDLLDVLAVEVSTKPDNYISNNRESHYLYTLLWEPLAPYLQNTPTVILSPTGLLNKVAFGTLRCHPLNTTRIMDRWDLHYFSDLRTLGNGAKKQFNAGDKALLVGGIVFDKMGRSARRPPSAPSMAARNASNRFAYLPGTYNEVIAIREILNNAGTTTEMYRYLVADEPELTRVCTQEKFGLLHLATHGYFFPDPKTKADEPVLYGRFRRERVLRPFEDSPYPLLRSGLALAEINHVWQGGTALSSEDGIWTALEIANLDLSATRLVVLSACETGRGTLDNYDGVLGLRRAFKLAGADQLILSLWKVPDQATADLMRAFYAAYVNGKTAAEALVHAQQTLRQRYPNPYYWGAFVLVE